VTRPGDGPTDGAAYPGDDRATARAGGAPLTLEIGRRLVPWVLLAGALGVAGGGALGIAILGGGAETPGSGAGSAIGGVIAAAVIAFGLFCLWAAYRGAGARMVLDVDGLHWRSVSRSWSLRWEDLDGVGLVVTTWSPPRALVTFGHGERTGRIVVRPRDADDPAVRNALRVMRVGDVPEPWTHWVTLGTNRDWIAAADEALGRLAGARYAGITERETFRRRYS
jgi:hypothetical protein